MLILISVGAIVTYSSYKNLFKPDGTTQEGLSNTSSRIGANAYNPTIIKENATYIQTATSSNPIFGQNVTYKVRDSELSQAGFITRRAALVGILPSFIQTDWMRNWVFS